MSAVLSTVPREPARTDEADRALVRSPGLGQFRTSPFRVLRLSLHATAKQAVWQCDKVLACVRVGLPLPEPDPLPWLPPGDEIELQDVARTLESPLARMVEQLLWFDPGDDAGAALIGALIAADGARLRGVLEAEPTASVEHRANRANLRLLLGFSQLHGAGPLVAPAGDDPPATLAWQRKGRVSLAEDPHRAVLPTPPSAPPAWAALLGEAMTAWSALLASPELADHVRVRIAALDDERLTADDLEAVLAALRTRIADLFAGEMKLELAEGRLGHASRLCAIAGGSQLDAETWRVAFRPLLPVFQSELAELAPEVETGLGVVEDVAARLDRLSALAHRWRAIDEAQLLGLSALIDEAAKAAFARLRGAPRAVQLGARFAEVVTRVGAVARSPSLQQRVRSYTEQLAGAAKAMCHFCAREPADLAYCAALSSKKEVSRELHGLGFRVQYQRAARPVARCRRCAMVHGFVHVAGTITRVTLGLALILPAIAVVSCFGMDASGGSVGVLLVLGLACVYGIGFLARDHAADRVTPKGDGRFNDYERSNAAGAMYGDGFTGLSYDFRPDAWQAARVSHEWERSR
jgi:hypothetical protein